MYQEERFVDLERAASGCVWEVPFVVIAYIPTQDGIQVDSQKTGYSGTVRSLQDRILRAVRVTKWMLEEGSRYHGYRDPDARPSLGYRCVRYRTVLEDIPRGKPAGGPDTYFPDYGKIVEQAGGRNLVRRGVREFWVYHWHHGTIVPIETNLASPVTGDISNSDRSNDLPIYENSYLVVGVNFNRGPDKHVHNIGHQLEAALSYIATEQDGNDNLFGKDFCGRDDRGKFAPGRCGNCHFPPNATQDYDYFNKTPALSDIEDWNPAGTGTKKPVSCATWESLPYRSPTGDRIRQSGTILEDDAWWYLYWFQNFPGFGSQIPYRDGKINNWWRFLGDWDGALREGYGLWSSSRPVGPRPGELELIGQVERMEGETLLLLVDTVRSPGKEPVRLPAPRRKSVLNPRLKGWPTGMRVRAIGESRGDGQSLRARLVQALPKSG